VSTPSDWFSTLGPRLPHLLRFLTDPIATPVFTSPASGSCWPGMADDAAADTEIPWDVTIPHLPGWDISEKVFKFASDGMPEEIEYTWDYNPTRLVITRGEHGVTEPEQCVDIMVVVYQTEEDSDPENRRVAGVVQFQICGKCPSPPSPPPPPPQAMKSKAKR
jgi:hypothetical protein